ncbi:MAG: DUF4124 domain-containing protein [Betaproteobacteria bacterium]|nr:DUF4124 domain-containing protein [Betaproteobacteria bacterium]
MKNRILISLSAVLALLAAAPAHALFKCTDEKGVTHYGDTMPPQCAKREIKELTRQGSTVKTIDAPKTPEQLKAEAEERERRRDIDRRMQEQKLKDGALIATYGSEREFDIAREKDIAVLDARKKTLQSRAPDVEKFLDKMTKEMEFYKEGQSLKAKAADGEAKAAVDSGKAKPRETKESKAKEAPAQVLADYNRARQNKADLDGEFAKLDNEKKAIYAKYEGEKNRWKRLKAGMVAGTLVNDQGETIAVPGMATQIVGQSTVIPGRPRGMAECGGKVYECTIGLDYICRAPDVGGPGVNAKLVPCRQNR